MTEQAIEFDAKKPEVFKAYKCQQCEAISMAEDLDRLYECGNDGSFGFGVDNRRCEQCSKFMAKVTDEGCPECMESEVEEVDCVVDDETNEVITLEDWEAEHSVQMNEDGTRKESARAERERKEEEAAARQVVKTALLKSLVTMKRFSDIVVGDRTAEYARTRHVDPQTRKEVFGVDTEKLVVGSEIQKIEHEGPREINGYRGDYMNGKERTTWMAPEHYTFWGRGFGTGYDVHDPEATIMVITAEAWERGLEQDPDLQY